MSDDLQAQPGKRGISYQMRQLTTEECVILKVGQETCRTRSHGLCKDWIVWGAPFQGEVSEPHFGLKTSENQLCTLSSRRFEENNEKQMMGKKITPAVEGERTTSRSLPSWQKAGVTTRYHFWKSPAESAAQGGPRPL